MCYIFPKSVILNFELSLLPFVLVVFSKIHIAPITLAPDTHIYYKYGKD